MSDAFDKKLREKLNEADIPFDPESWQKMEKKLDAFNDDGSSRRRIFWWWLAPLLLLLLGTGAYLWWRQMTPSSDLQQSAGKVNEERTVDTSSNTLVGKDSNAQSSQTDVQGQRQEQQMPPSTSIPRETTTVADKKDIPAPARPAANRAGIPGPVANRQQAPAVPSYPREREAVVAEEKEKTQNTESRDHNNISQPQVVPQPEEKKTTSSRRSDSSRSPVKEPVKEITKAAIAKESKEKDTPPKRKGFSVGLMLGPVLNVAPSIWYGRIGMDAGVLLTYHVNNRWSFTSGAIYSTKPYGGLLSDYGASKKWPPPYNPAYSIKRIDANCKVLDVPLNINYAFMDKTAYTLSASAGLSSYFMLKEKYDYKYQGVAPQQKEFTNDNQHYMAVLNLAFTYQFPLNNNMSLGIQPFAKVPLRGVGFGEVKLFSTGVAVQMNFNRFKRVP